MCECKSLIHWLQVVPALRESLRKLKLDYIDLFLTHWPMAVLSGKPGEPLVPDNETNIYTETWPGMEECVELGLAKNIGVSNYNSVQIDELMKVAKIKPVINQVESHPFLSQRKLKDHCAKYGIVLTAYSPLGGSPIDSDRGNMSKDVRPCLFENLVLKELASKYNKSVGQILLKFQVQRGVITIPKSVTPSRIAENVQLFDFQMTQEDIDKLESLNRNLRYVHAKDRAAHKNYPFNIEY